MKDDFGDRRNLSDGIPAINGDPESLPQDTEEKQFVSPDPEKVRKAGREDSPLTKGGDDHLPVK